MTQATKKGIWCLKVYDDSKLAIKQVINKCSAKIHHLKFYKNRVWDFMESFIAFNFKAISRKYNQIVDALPRKGTRFNYVHHIRGTGGVKMINRPSILNMVNY